MDLSGTGNPATVSNDRSELKMPAGDKANLDHSDRVAEVDFLGMPFATLDLPSVVQILATRPAHARFAFVATPNAQHLVQLRRGEDGFSFGLSRAWFLTCDSQVLRRLGQHLFGIKFPLVTGSDLTMYLLRKVIDPDEPVTIIGGNEELRRELGEKYRWRKIALYSPPFGFSRDADLLGRCIGFVRDNPARFVFLACGAPQSEVLAAHIVEAKCATGIGLCVGASLLFATGQLKRAPLLWQSLGLEWLFRLIQEPRRLAHKFWHAQLPVLGIAARAWLLSRDSDVNVSILKRPS
jgi:N-acetylglucosaminyldiphosphoundecaprenol N-acetyl-beta-D-mannosaminyltransferase